MSSMFLLLLLGLSHGTADMWRLSGSAGTDILTMVIMMMMMMWVIMMIMMREVMIVMVMALRC